MSRKLYESGRNRAGFTRTELVVVVVCLLLGCTIIGPGLLSRRSQHHKLYCLNNIRHTTFAIHNAAAGTGGKLVRLTAPVPVTNSAGQQGTLVASWPVQILPALDATALLKQIKANAIIESGQARIHPDEHIFLNPYTCPDDPNAYHIPGRLSYVLNAGFISQHLYHSDPNRKHTPGTLTWIGLPGDDDATAVQAATGVTWHPSTVAQISLDSIAAADGESNTLLLVENLQAGQWYDTDTASLAFGFPVPNTKGQVAVGSGQLFESADKPLNTQFAGGTLDTASRQDWRINRNLRAKLGTLPRPSSIHAGGVNVTLCDGSLRFLNENIDPHVYLKLMTWNGAVYGEGELKPSDDAP